MTAVDVDALDAADCPLPRCTPPPGGMCGSCPILHNLLAEVRRGRALREAVEGLADSLDVDSCDPMPDDRARLLYETAQRIRAALAAVDPS